MRRILLLLLLAIFAFGCSGESENNTLAPDDGKDSIPKEDSIPKVDENKNKIIKISVDYYEEVELMDATNVDALFQINLTAGEVDTTKQSKVFKDISGSKDIFSFTYDIDDDITSFDFTIYALEDNYSLFIGYPYIDYTQEEDSYYYTHLVSIDDLLAKGGKINHNYTGYRGWGSFSMKLCNIRYSVELLQVEKDSTIKDDEPIEEEVDNLEFSLSSVGAIPVSVVNAMDKEEFKALKIVLKNNSAESKTAIINSVIDGYSLEDKETVELEAFEKKILFYNPTFKSGWSEKVTEITPVKYTVEVSLVDGETTENIFAKSLDVDLLPKDEFVWSMNDANDDLIDFTKYLAKLVIPKDDAVKELVSKSIDKTPNESFTGYQTEDIYYLGDCFEVCSCPKGSDDAFGNVGDIHLYLNDANSYWTFEEDDEFPRSCRVEQEIVEDGDEFYLTVCNIGDSKDDYIAKTEVGVFSAPSRTIEVSSEDGSLEATFYANNEVYMQVQAIYETLQKDYEVKYVSSTLDFGTNNSQRIVLPSDVLKQGQANCIDGTLILASALENVGIKPVVVLVPGHAYLGFYLDEAKKQVQFVETTMLGNADFYWACKYGDETYAEDADFIKDEKDGYQIIDIETLRKEGITSFVD